MIQRLAAAAVGLAVVVPALVWGGVVAVDVLVPLVGVLCIAEYVSMAFPADRNAALAWQLFGAGTVYATLVYAGPAAAPLVAALVVVATLSYVTLRPGEALQEAADVVGRHLVGIAWIGGFLAFLPLLRRLEHGLAWVFLVLAISWCSDTGGYFAGRFFGRRKLYPRVSPKKTWEGLLGGVALAVVGALVVRAVGLPHVAPHWAGLLGALLAAVGVVGDLSESLLKRSFDVKDSGWIMPGHGGLLDRIDSVLFVAPLLYGYAVLIHG